jgi:16S rRNA (guanine527-N7)-methyltransferase
MNSALALRVNERAAAAGIELSASLTDGLVAYLEMLARWNRRINLTAFDLDAPSDDALDRLVIEGVGAARLVRREDRRAIDIGSGGGSPAIPLLLAAPWLEMVLVESRSRKAAFLREAARSLPVSFGVETARVEDFAASNGAGPFDLATFRAVRADVGLWNAVDGLLGPGGRVLWFGGIGQVIENFGFALQSGHGSIALMSRTES